MADPRVRVKVGDEVYPARATRVRDASLIAAMREAGGKKYDRPGGDARVTARLVSIKRNT